MWFKFKIMWFNVVLKYVV